ncbi:hypothetical protein CC1G_10998 [Coprinopsis cinerea okayama7|uniref:Uncharacterized protein n=1 Tax=Coprinopsis cinerea (strain Okayama-7 / 130 / ATCC MYA-4618 / FGSC 9003) TaxID=240176 RepID=A8P726_COPC7|nr:hypothetical protein CC1G_10998 [Coprinopsis cinerea okayama7\|eukprot:XP_001839276.2 hypothetical protein CC1G_10998 [Coprinopsis cinerea okayama7\
MDPDALYGVKTTNYIAVGSIAVWVYDYILVLPHEDCHIAFALSVFIGSISSFVCEAVMYIQVWIVCQQSIGIGAYLCLQFTASLLHIIPPLDSQLINIQAQIMMCLILEGVFIRGMECSSPDPAPDAEPTPPFKGCWPSSGQDGLIYMYGMVGFSIAGTITMYQAPRTLRWVWAIPTRVFGNILVSRLIIHLRRTASETADGNWGSLEVSESISEMPTFSEPPGLAEDEHTSHPDARPISRQDLVCQFPAYSKTSSGTQVTNGNGQRIV